MSDWPSANETGHVSHANPSNQVALILCYARQLQSMGAPVGRLMGAAGIRVDLLNYPAAGVPLENAFRFADLACRTQGTEHLGLQGGLATSLDDLDPYGQTPQ